MRCNQIIRSTALALAVCSLLASGCSGSGDEDKDSGKDDETTTTVAEARSASMTPTEVLSADLAYSTFAELVTVAELGPELDDLDALTMFVPSDAVFDELGDDATEQLLEDPDRARAFVEQYLVARSGGIAELLTAAEPLETLSGESITVEAVDGVITIGGATLVTPDIPTANGYLNVIGGTVETDSAASADQ